MKYTRKPQQSREVTFTVSWVEQPITIPTVGSMPYEAALKAKLTEDMGPLFNLLPDEISTLLDTASNDEVGEFLMKWGEASEADDKARSRTESMFERLIRGLS